MKPLLSDSAHAEMTSLAADFEDRLGPKLQRYLWLKWLWSDNYISDWWEEYVYLRGRSPIMINSNFYALDTVYKHPTTNQVSVYNVN